MNAWLLAVFTFLGAFAGTYVMRVYALSRGVLDIPNRRSSHTFPTPRGGGVAIVVASAISLLVLLYQGLVSGELCLALVGGGLLVAIIGYLDDRKPLPAQIRLVVHVAAAIWAVVCLGVPSALQFGNSIVPLGSLAYPFSVLAIVWSLNLVNFMDGIDGIAASEAAFVLGASALITMLTSSEGTSSDACVVLAAGALGFLVWNWAPAKIFMGDVGSGFLGYIVAVLAIAESKDDPAAPFTWLILMAVFATDATITLVRRLVRGERVHEAHRSHAYQRLARRLGSHGCVTAIVLGVNIVWLFPIALIAALFPRAAVFACVVAITPVVVLAIRLGSGRPEMDNSS